MKRVMDILRPGVEYNRRGDVIEMLDGSEPPTAEEVAAVEHEIAREDTRDAKLSEIRIQRDAVLAAGFAWNGARWDASDAVTPRMVELSGRLAIDDSLPRGKTAYRLRDAAGGAHELDKAALSDLLRAGNDFRDAVGDRAAELLDQVAAAATLDDLEAIDIETGWPG